MARDEVDGCIRDRSGVGVHRASGMSGARRLRILSELAEASDSGVTASRLCAAMKVTSTTGAGTMIMSGESPIGSACTTG